MKKAKIVFMLFAAFLLLSANAFAAVVSMPDLNVDPGTAVQIPVNIDDATGLAAVQFTVTYDQAVLTCTGVLRGSLTGGWDSPTVNTGVAGQISWLSTDPNLNELPGGTGSLFLIQCTAGSTGGASTTLHFAEALLSDGSGSQITTTSDDGSLTISGGCTDNDEDTYSPDGGDCGPVDCDDNNAAVNPGATEVCNNVDDDCDIVVDEDANGDPLTRPTTCGVGACESTGTETCTSGVWGNDTCTPGTPGTEVCNNIDDDCNGTIDDGIAPVPTTCGVGACAASGEETCVNGVMVDNCTPGSPTSDDNCDGEDQDCDGTADEDYVPTATVCGVGACESTGEMVCTVNHVLANTCVPGLPGTEGPFGDATCSDAVDNDCDGAADGADIDCAALREVSAPAVSVLVNENIQIPVNIDDATGIAGYQFTVTYDPAVLDCTSVVNGTLTGSWDAPTVNAAAGQISFISTEPNLIPLAGGSGSLALIECLVLNNPGASTAVTFTESILSDENGNPVPAQATAGSVTVSTCVPSGTDDNCDGEDQDCDGTADEDYVPTATVCGVGACESTGEMVCTVNHVLANTCVPGLPGTEGPFGDATCSDAVDNDCDGAADGADIDCAALREVSAPAVTTDAGQPVQIPLSVDDATGIAGYQFTVTYDPAVLDCTSAVNGTLTAGWDEVSVNASAGQITVLSTEPNLIPLGGGSGSLVVLECTAANNPGASTVVTITLSVLSDENGDPVPSQATAGSVTINGCNPSPEICDGIDNDCDGFVDNGIAPQRVSCGIGACLRWGKSVCENGAMVDYCTPGDPSQEICNNIDDDCDGAVDDDLIRPTNCGIGSCAASGFETCTAGVWGNDTCTPGSPAAEVCDGDDNDCDGTVDDGIAPVRTSCGTGACASYGRATCVGGQMVDSCTPGDPSQEICNNIDDDCDGGVDEDLTRQTSCGVGSCAATGTETCSAGVWGNDTCTAGSPSAEVCDSQDNDCDGSVDEGIAPQRISCGEGVCLRWGRAVCQNGQTVDICTPGQPGTEGPLGDATCSDLKDNDCDGTTDAADTDCQ